MEINKQQATMYLTVALSTLQAGTKGSGASHAAVRKHVLGIRPRKSDGRAFGGATASPKFPWLCPWVLCPLWSPLTAAVASRTQKRDSVASEFRSSEHHCCHPWSKCHRATPAALRGGARSKSSGGSEQSPERLSQPQASLCMAAGLPPAPAARSQKHPVRCLLTETTAADIYRSPNGPSRLCHSELVFRSEGPLRGKGRTTTDSGGLR